MVKNIVTRILLKKVLTGALRAAVTRTGAVLLAQKVLVKSNAIATIAITTAEMSMLLWRRYISRTLTADEFKVKAIACVASNAASFAGAAIGGVIGGFIGSFLGPAGTWLGSMLGSFIGGLVAGIGAEAAVVHCMTDIDEPTPQEKLEAFLGAARKLNLAEYEARDSKAVKTEYRRLALRYHPDKHVDSTDEVKV